MQFKVVTLDGGSSLIEIDRAELSGGGEEAGWDLATARLHKSGFDVLDWITDEDGSRILIVGD
jgi:hypothetical protein